MTTKLGDPKFAFTVYFPICFMLSHSVGVRVLWVAVLSEWLNAVFKWYIRQFIIQSNHSLIIIDIYISMIRC